ncbi:MAG: insulinase family protein [bacterium]|nr:insulinase family protein [bacterium]
MRSILIVFFLILLAISAVASEMAPIETYTLPNGLTVILHQDTTQPMVTINTWFHVGSKDENEGRTGFAHLFEHLMFMGTERVPDNQFDMQMERGGGANNASTGVDRTNYYSWGPRSLLPTLLWLDADRLEGLSKAMTLDKLNLQRNVVRNERRQNVENQPYGISGLILPKALYPDGHPYQHSIIGSHEDLEAGTVEDVKNFFDTYYVPGNASLVVAGDFDVDEAKGLIARTFGAVPARPLPLHKTALPVQLEREVRRMATDRVRYPRLYLVWHSPAGYQDGDADMDVISTLLASGSTGRLYERLVLREKLAQRVSCYQYSKQLGSEFHVEVTASAGADLEHIKQIILEEIDELREKGPTDAEMTRVQASTESGFLRSKESLQRRADMLNAYRKAYGEANSFDRELARRLAPTAASVQHWAGTVLGEGRVDLRILPEGETTADVSLDDRPENLSDRPVETSSATRLELKNGQPLYVVSRPGSGLFSGQIIIDGGERLVPAEKAGLGSLVATMLTQGTDDLDAAAFADAVATLGGQVRANCGNNAVTVGVSGLTSRLDETLSLLGDALIDPALTADDFSREKDQALAAIESRTENANRVAQNVLRASLFGHDDPRGRPGGGFGETVEKLTHDDLTDLLPRLVTPERASYVFVGDFTARQIKSALDKHLGKWKGEDDRAPALQPLTAPQPGFLLVDRPGAPQTIIMLGRPVPAPSESDRVTRDCLNTLFGASFTSRLNQNIREEHGYSYGARSRFVEDSGQWVLMSWSGVQTAVTGPALNEFRKEFTGLNGGDVTHEELEKAVRTVRFDLENAGATTGDMTGLVAGFVANGRPVDAVKLDLKQIPAVDLQTINEVAASGLYAWDDLLIVLVGDREKVLPQLKEAGFPTPIIVDADGKQGS